MNLLKFIYWLTGTTKEDLLKRNEYLEMQIRHKKELQDLEKDGASFLCPNGCGRQYHFNINVIHEKTQIICCEKCECFFTMKWDEGIAKNTGIEKLPMPILTILSLPKVK